MWKVWMAVAMSVCGWQALALEINQASEAELDGLRGIGPPFTRRLLAAREERLFTDWQDLRSRVKGMGPKLSQSLSDIYIPLSWPVQRVVRMHAMLKPAMSKREWPALRRQLTLLSLRELIGSRNTKGLTSTRFTSGTWA